MKRSIIFTHIQKTAGTSVMKELLYENFRNEEIRRFWGGFGIKKLILSNTSQYKVFTGHFPYGIHHFIKGECDYITFLREPISRAVSHYNFIKNNIGETNNENKYKTLHQEFKLKDIFKHNSTLNPFKGILVDNMQSRMLAGYLYFPFPKNSKLLLLKAKQNLEKKYKAFGIQEQYEVSMQLLAQSFDWQYSPQGIRAKETQKKEEIDTKTMEVLIENHQLDIELYRFAKELFESRLK